MRMPRSLVLIAFASCSVSAAYTITGNVYSDQSCTTNQTTIPTVTSGVCYEESGNALIPPSSTFAYKSIMHGGTCEAISITVYANANCAGESKADTISAQITQNMLSIGGCLPVEGGVDKKTVLGYSKAVCSTGSMLTPKLWALLALVTITSMLHIQ